ncbi:hypothetical protein HK100_009195, partial [Physocladia obscura]
PTPGRVLKTEFQSKPRKECGADIPDDVQKVFVNIAFCSEIEEAKPSSGSENNGQKKGQAWSIPYSLTPGRVDVDKGLEDE